MLSQPGAPLVLAALTSSIISDMILIASIFINNNFQLKREEQQGIRQQKSDQQKWYREKIYDSYRTAINLLTDMIQIKFEFKENYMPTKDKYIILHKLSLKLLAECEIITSGYVSGYPIKNVEEFKEKMINFADYLETDPTKARTILTDLMESDSRIKDINNS